MYIHEYGNRSDPIVILLAPMMVSGDNLYHMMRPHLKGSYHIIAPDQGGHGNSGPYISADAEYATLREWLLRNGYREIALLFGASMGVAVAYRLFLDPAFTIHRAWFDGVALVKNAAFAERFMRRLFRRRKIKQARKPVLASESLARIYGFDFARMMTRNFERITPNDIDAICHACCHYDLRSLTNEEQTKLHLDFGEKDFDWRYSKKTVPVYMPKAELTLRKGYAHCAYMAAHPKEYVGQLEAWMLK